MYRPSSRAILIALAIFLYLPLAYRYGWLLTQKSTVDFPTFWYAGVLTFEQDKTPYGAHAFDEASKEMAQRVHPYVYPPPSLLVWWPFSDVPFPVAQTLFLISGHLCYLAAVWLLLYKLTPLPSPAELRDRAIAFCLVYLLLYDPAVVTLEVGQINLVTLLFLCCALVAMRVVDRPAWQIALPLSIAILLKTYPVLLLLPLALRRRWSAMALTCVFFGVYTALAGLCLKPEIWLTWWQEVVPKGGYTNDPIAAAGPWNQNLHGFVTRLFVDGSRFDGQLHYPLLAKALVTGLAFAVCAITMLAVFRSARRADQRVCGDFEVAAFLLMIFLVAPLSWDHHLVYILPAALLAISLLLRGELKGAPAAIVAAALFLVAWRLPLWEPSASFAWSTLFISMKLYAAIALWVFFIVRLWRFGSVKPQLPKRAKPAAAFTREEQLPVPVKALAS
ncbi:MAG: DUF2029 domain-containing protein [Verrucomicrobiaceae bacterium]|nr:DUF2029 domain-containing protein [Verrucomicrobiaceae bacterium]